MNLENKIQIMKGLRKTCGHFYLLVSKCKRNQECDNSIEVLQRSLVVMPTMD